MSLCINPNCRFANPDSVLFCHNCGSELLLQGRYQVTRLLSNQGGCADTYEVLYQDVPKILKVLRDWQLTEDVNKQKIIELFEREFQVLSKSNHPGIPKAEDYFQYTPKNEQASLYCLVMEKIVGMNLEEYLDQLDKPIDQKSALLWLEQLVRILREVHNQGLIHRDIKPSNIILKPNGQLALIDFGVVGKFSSVQPKRSNTYVYSTNYTAQEQIQGNAVPQSDFFSLGRTIVYLLTKKDLGEFNYTDDNSLDWHEFASGISPQFIKLIDWLMAPLVEQRPTNADEILQRLTGFKQTKTQTRTTATNGNILRWPIVLGGLIFLILSGGAIFTIVMGRGGTNKTLTNSSSSQSSLQSPPQSSSQCSESTIVKKSGNLYGVIEVGSKGIKGEVIQELATPNTEGFKFIAREEEIPERNANPVDPKAQTETINSVKAMFGEIQERFGIPCEQIIIYGSSGVAQKAPHKEALAKEIQQQTGRAVDFISAEEEANLVFDGVVPQWRREQVVMIDIGSGNTKGAYLKSAQKPENVTFSIMYGTKTFTDEINNSRGNTDFITAAVDTKRKILIPEIRDLIQRKPGAQNLPRVYLAGGISWALSTLMRPCEQEQSVANIREERVARFARVYPEDINTFYFNATRDQKTLFAPNLDKCNAEQRKKVQKSIDKIKTGTFSKDNLIAGAEILRALSDELKFSEKERIFFAHYAIEALPIGYLIQKLESAERLPK
ncbi:MAG: protein kinase [Desmonostoc vinosum HA7617-LM4]|jgi:serine/threonine protein kinase|nr:protein kinase [Desmonostoc vinosum HA7617-LM4]